MRALLAAALALVSTACLRQTQFRCTDDTECGAGGVCESDVGYCSFADGTCPDGRRYGSLSGPFASKCVGANDMIDAPLHDGPPDMPMTPNDTDGDGVVNASDNCPTVANADQHNEDGDPLGDACDPCPPFAINTDVDGDGVGDLCDPNPATAGDSLVAFEGFGGGVPTGWTPTGTWTAAGDDLSTSAAAGAASFLVVASTMTSKETVSTSVTIGALAGTTNTVGPLTDFAGGTNYIACVVYRTNAGGPSPALGVYDANNLNTAAVTGYEMTNGATYVIRLKRATTSYSCAADRAGAMQNVSGTYALANAPYSVGITASGIAARYQWVMVVRSP